MWSWWMTGPVSGQHHQHFHYVDETLLWGSAILSGAVILGSNESECLDEAGAVLWKSVARIQGVTGIGSEHPNGFLI